MTKPLYALMIGTLLLPATTAVAEEGMGNAENGMKLHEQHCSRCHGTDVYVPPKRKIQSLELLKQRSTGCNSMTGANLFPEEVRDIVEYLNTSFYKFDR